MATVDFSVLSVGQAYTRHRLCAHWGYRSFQAIARGVVTPAQGGVIILFVTEEKTPDMPQYADALSGRVLAWDGPTDHYAEDRMVAGRETIQVFFRRRTRQPFTYLGPASVTSYAPNVGQPSRFLLTLTNHPPGSL